MAKNSVDSREPLDELRDLVGQLDGDSSAPKKKTDRRGILKVAGAAVIGAAGLAATRIVPASAATGGAMILGCNNDASTDTRLTNSGGSVGLSVVQGVTAVQGTATGGTNEVGVAGVSKTGNGKGVGGQATTGIGVGGQATTGQGVHGEATTGQGVRGEVSTGIGVYGDATGAGTGALFYSQGGGYDAALGFPIVGGAVGSGRLGMVGRLDVGGVGPGFAPSFQVTSTGTFTFEHELVRGNDGSIWASRFDASSTPTSKRWKRINAVRVDAGDGTGANFKPFRVIDTRVTPSPPLAGGKPAHGTVGTPNFHVVTVAGTGAGTSAIPPDAIAVMGNLTAVGYGGAGFLAVMPGGIVAGTGAGQYNPAADPSSVNFITGQAAIANAFVCGLHNGQLQVFIGVADSHFIVDITAYLQ